MKKNKIGWQKYENVLEDQLSSPFLSEIMEMISPPGVTEEIEGYLTEEKLAELEAEIPFMGEANSPKLVMSQEILGELAMITNFDCWVGHTNFDITPTVRKALNETEGVELLKVCSRYRFFIGVGKMFNFKTVRKRVESRLLNLSKDSRYDGNEQEDRKRPKRSQSTGDNEQGS